MHPLNALQKQQQQLIATQVAALLKNTNTTVVQLQYTYNKKTYNHSARIYSSLNAFLNTHACCAPSEAALIKSNSKYLQFAAVNNCFSIVRVYKHTKSKARLYLYCILNAHPHHANYVIPLYAINSITLVQNANNMLL